MCIKIIYKARKILSILFIIQKIIYNVFPLSIMVIFIKRYHMNTLFVHRCGLGTRRTREIIDHRGRLDKTLSGDG
mgnify:CR=1 FL=1